MYKGNPERGQKFNDLCRLFEKFIEDYDKVFNNTTVNETVEQTDKLLELYALRALGIMCGELKMPND